MTRASALGATVYRDVREGAMLAELHGGLRLSGRCEGTVWNYMSIGASSRLPIGMRS